VRVAGWRAAWPLAVMRPTRTGKPRPLVVLPAATWQGENRQDDDRNGFADSLDRARSVSLARPFSAGRLPTGLRREAAPLLRFLDSAHLPYDLTTDISLARGEGPPLARRTGVVFPGTERWLPEPLVRRLRGYVVEGGRIASFGAGSFRRSVGLSRDRLRAPAGARTLNLFGERTSIVRDPAAPLVVDRDDLRLFGGTGASLGTFSVFERSQALPGSARVLASAGQGPGKADFVAYRLGRGLVVRTGTPQWASALSADGPVAAATRQIWRLLRRR
jgi:N,N-dimethylformamidase beta subunit-like protein